MLNFLPIGKVAICLEILRHCKISYPDLKKNDIQICCSMTNYQIFQKPEIVKNPV